MTAELLAQSWRDALVQSVGSAWNSLSDEDKEVIERALKLKAICALYSLSPSVDPELARRESLHAESQLEGITLIGATLTRQALSDTVRGIWANAAKMLTAVLIGAAA